MRYRIGCAIFSISNQIMLTRIASCNTSEENKNAFKWRQFTPYR
jgi:hypothetical protein